MHKFGWYDIATQVAIARITYICLLAGVVVVAPFWFRAGLAGRGSKQLPVKFFRAYAGGSSSRISSISASAASAAASSMSSMSSVSSVSSSRSSSRRRSRRRSRSRSGSSKVEVVK